MILNKENIEKFVFINFFISIQKFEQFYSKKVIVYFKN